MSSPQPRSAAGAASLDSGATGRADTYARVFFEASFERWLGALNAVHAELAENRALFERLQASDLEFGERQRLLDTIVPADVDLTTRNLLLTLLERGDLDLLEEIGEALRRRARSAEAVPTQVEVVTAGALPDEQRTALEATLARQYGQEQELAFHYRVDPSILGGMIVRIGDRLIDGSVAARLTAMKQALGVAPGE